MEADSQVAGGGAGPGCVCIISWAIFNYTRSPAMQANDNSGYIGASIVGGFLAIVAAGYTLRWSIRKVRDRRK
jgi:uncharacterized membrane protein YphA (DoxX/SURF4 family)